MAVDGKTHTNLLTEADIARIRTTKTWAGVIVNEALATANSWMGYTINELRDLVPPAYIGRNPNVHQDQCPLHPDEIKSVGKYPWIVNPDKPYTVTCPVGGETYPTNEFDPYDLQALGTVSSEPYVDYGAGYLNPLNSQRYYFVGYYAHWLYYGHLKPAALALGQAYVITGDTKYARQAAALLDRIAEEYPDMMLPNGRIVNSVWENEMIRYLATAYDYIYPGIEGDIVLESAVGKSIAQIRQNIETNLLENAAQSIFTTDGRIRGNYGMHQNALATLALVLDNQNTDKYLNMVLNATGLPEWEYEGIRNGLINMVFRDGAPLESSPYYNAFWMEQINDVARLLLSRGINLYEQEPKLKSLIDYPLRIAMLDRFSPNIGDTGGVKSSGIHGWSDYTYSTAYQQYGDELYRAGRSLSRQSDNMSAYGLAMLRTGQGADAAGVALYYGRGSGHDHFGRLNIEFFAKGLRISPDVGYPDYADYADKKRWAYVSNTSSHNTVVVNAQRQTTRDTGKLELFNATPRVQYIDASGLNAYPDLVNEYRRSVVLIGVKENEAYAVDLFRVNGGTQHDYSLHGPDGTFTALGLELTSPQTMGTLAGDNVPFGYLYDWPHLEAPGYDQGYNVYSGSGFSYFRNTQHGASTDVWDADWTAAGTQNTHFRATFVPEEGTHVYVADAEPPKNVVGNPPALKYVFARRTSPNGAPLKSTFVTVLQPYTEQPFISQVERLSVSKSTGVALQITHTDGTDYIIQSANADDLTAAADLHLQGVLGVFSRSTGGLIRYANLVGGTLLEQGDVKIEANRSYTGVVLSVDYELAQVTVALADQAPEMPLGEILHQQRIVFKNKHVTTEYVIDSVSAKGERTYVIQLVEKALITGTAIANQVNDRSVYTKTALPLSEYYLGQMLVNPLTGQAARILAFDGSGEHSEGVPEATLRIADNVGLKVNDHFNLYDFGADDQFTITSSVHLQETGAGVYTIESNVSGKLTLWDNVERAFPAGVSTIQLPTIDAYITQPQPAATLTGDVIPAFTITTPASLVVDQIAVYVDKNELYAGRTLPPPDALMINTRLLSDGEHVFSVAITDQYGKTHLRQVPFKVENWWRIDTELIAPVASGWFGTIDTTQIQQKSFGWQFMEDQANQFFNDNSRLVKMGNGAEHIIWETMSLQEFHLTVFAQEQKAVNQLELSVSSDGVVWEPLSFTVTESEPNSFGWRQYAITGQVNSTLTQIRLFRITSSAAEQELHLGRVQLAGYR
ncbi:MAG: heparinase II/III domain-containing protein [Limnochordia bacterium]